MYLTGDIISKFPEYQYKRSLRPDAGRLYPTVKFSSAPLRIDYEERVDIEFGSKLFPEVGRGRMWLTVLPNQYTYATKAKVVAEIETRMALHYDEAAIDSARRHLLKLARNY